MSRGLIEYLDGRTMLSAAGAYQRDWAVAARSTFDTAIPAGIKDTQGARLISTDQRVFGIKTSVFSEFDLMLAISKTYGNPDGTFRDYDENGVVDFDDVLALVADRGNGSFPSPDIALSFALDGIVTRGPGDAKQSFAHFENNIICIVLGGANNLSMRTSISKTGRLCIFVSDGDHSEAELISVKASSVGAIRIMDSAASRTITLATGFPSASIFLGGGNDKLIANENANTIYGGDGNDTIYAGDGADVVFGDAGVDRLSGQGGIDYLDGGSSIDYLDGGKSKNFLVGGKGADQYTRRTNSDKIDHEPDDVISTIA